MVAVFVVVLLLIGLFYLYTALPPEHHIETVDEYIARVAEKVEVLNSSDIDEVTSNRSGILRKYVRYIFREQPIWKFLFGGNGVMVTGGVPHNTYIDWVLQFGLFGLIFLVSWLVVRFFHAPCAVLPAKQKKMLFIMKAIYLLFAMTLSIYDGAPFALLFFFVFFL